MGTGKVASTVLTASGLVYNRACRVYNVCYDTNTPSKNATLYDGLDTTAGRLRASLGSINMQYGQGALSGLYFERGCYLSTDISSGKITVIFEPAGDGE